MNSTCIRGCLFLVFLPLGSPALESKEIRELSKEPHGAKDRIPELAIFPDVREYEVKMTITKPAGEVLAESKTRIAEKIVRGRYLVSVFRPPNMEESIVRVVTFDKETSSYRRWVLMPGGEPGESIGISLPGTRTISWTALKNADESKESIIEVETHSNEASTWLTYVIEEKKVLTIMKGVASRSKSR